MKKLNNIFLLYNNEGFLDGFALTVKEANDRGYVHSSPVPNRKYYREVQR